jgi:hypothetical protein
VNMPGEILGVSATMLTSVVSGLTLLLLTASLFWLVLSKRGGRWFRAHRVLAYVLAAGIALHGAWGFVAVFVLKS